MDHLPASGSRASRGWFTGLARPGIGAEGFGRETSPFDGENCLRSALLGFLGGRFVFVDKSDFLAHFFDFAALVNVDRIDLIMAAKESPSTNRFYRLSAIANGSGDEYTDFANRVVALTGIIAIPAKGS